MERSEKVGLGVAVAGHVALFALLSLGFVTATRPPEIKQQPIDVSLVPDVAVEAQAPRTVEPPAPSVAPEQGAPEDAAPPEPQEAEPEPEPRPAPPQPKPARPKPAPEPKPVERPKPQPKPAPAPKPQVKPKPAPVAKPAPAKPAPAAPAKTAATKPARPAASAKSAKPVPTKGAGSSATATATRPRGSRLGNDFLKGLSADPSPAKGEAPRAAKVGVQQLANIGAAIKRQVQPCANQQVNPGPGSERIQVAINLKLNRDGSLAARPRVTEHVGVDDENQRYVARVDDLAIATFTGCSPLTGLPEDLYDAPGGWRSFTLRYKLPG